MRIVDTKVYVSALRELTEEGKEVSLVIAGNSMSPFLVDKRDVICFRKPDRDLRRGDMVFYQRENGQFIMHRIYKAGKEGFYIVGDAQQEIEGPLRREQIFAVVTKARRKGKWIGPGDFWWDFFEHVWIRMVGCRHLFVGVYGVLHRLFVRRRQN